MEAATLSQSCSGHLPFLCRTSACDVTTGSDLLSFAWTFNRGAKKELLLSPLSLRKNLVSKAQGSL